MKRRIGVGAFLGILAMAFYLYIANQRAADADALSDMSAWAPSAQSIQQTLHGTAQPDADKLKQFEELFTSRFRARNMAVRINLFDDQHNVLKQVVLKCPARMEPWYQDRLAIALWREYLNDFGHAADIDIYETYIGATSVKVGEVRTPAAPPLVAQIVHIHPQPVAHVNSPSRTLTGGR